MPDPILVTDLSQTGRATIRDPNLAPVFSSYNADFTGSQVYVFDFNRLRNAEQFGVVRTLFVDNSSNPSEVEVAVSGTDQYFTIPANGQGYFNISASAQSQITLTSDGGATDLVTVIFYNYELPTGVWYRYGTFNNDRPIKAEGTMESGATVASEDNNNPIFIGGVTSGGVFIPVRVDALGRLDFSSSISVGGIFGADPMGGAPVNPGVVLAVLDSAGDIQYLALNANGELTVNDADANTSLATLVSQGTAPSVGALSSVAGTTSDAVILATNANRKGAAIYNDSTAILYIALANVTASTTNYTTQIDPGGYFEISDKYTGVVKGIWAAANGAARVTEHT